MKVLFTAAIALLVLAAGCITTPSETPAAAADVPMDLASTAAIVHGAAGAAVAWPAGLVAAAGGAYHTGLPAAEPTIGTTSDGSIFMTANTINPTCATVSCPALPYANFNAGPTLVRSQDKGQTWVDVFPKLPTGDSYKLRTWDPMVVVDRATDRVFMDDIYPIGCGFMSWSDDAGESWMHNPASCGNPNVNDHQTVGTAKPRMLPTTIYPNLVYRCVNNGALSACAVSLTGGQTFLPQIPVAPQSGCGGITGHLESDSEGRMFLPMSCPGNAAALAMTEDDGQSWSILTISEENPSHGLHVDIAIDEADNVYALWESEGLPWFAASTDHGATWTKPLMVGAPGVTLIKFNAIDAGAPGKVAFAYVGTTIPDAQELPGSQCGALPALPCSDPEEWASATWNAYVGVMTDALSAAPVIQTVTANDPADPLARGACADRCHGMTDFIDIRIDAEGRPWASFVDVCVAECVTDAETLFDGNLGLVATTAAGPALRGEIAALPVLAKQIEASE
ncbi:MAG TPA: sialidase family protein [Candidatus Thermoplasmatota archaeon]|nr:sialidase family protein [Candidatus Thermoplasmatota archaeon]